jgi:hypothetical protein
MKEYFSRDESIILYGSDSYLINNRLLYQITSPES